MKINLSQYKEVLGFITVNFQAKEEAKGHAEKHCKLCLVNAFVKYMCEEIDKIERNQG